MSNLFQELKRRNVFRVAAAYGLVGWLVIQVIDTITPRLGLPEWLPTLVIVVVLLGLPLALVVAWAFEVTTQGLKRTQDVGEGESIVHAAGQKLNTIVIAALVLALGYAIWQNQSLQYGQTSDTQTDTTSTVTEVPTAPLEVVAPITDKSIAVLPFADFSADGGQGWFGDGLSEEILNSLVRIPDLKVASRTSSFSYRDSTLEITEIAKAIGVAHILEGSVRRSDTRLRVTAQLIRAADGFHLWSENYDRAPDDAIAIQEDLAISISQALQTAMDPVALAAMANVGTESIAAYNAYLEGLSFSPCGLVDLSCLSALERAIGIDPEFAEAQFQLADYWQVRLQVNDVVYDEGSDYAEVKERFQRHVASAIEFAKNPVELLKYRAMDAVVDMRLADRAELLLAYLESRPNDADSWMALADAQRAMGDMEGSLRSLKTREQLDSRIERAAGLIQQYHQTGDPASAARLARRAMIEAPTNRDVLFQAHRGLLMAGEVSEAAEAARLYHQSPFVDSDSNVREIATAQLLDMRQACAEGREADATQIYASFATSEGARPSTHWQALTTLGRNQEAEDIIRVYDSSDTVLQLFSFYEYPYFDPRPVPFLMEVLEREGVVLRPLIPIPYACG